MFLNLTRHHAIQFCGCWSAHCEALKQCEDSAIGIDNPELISYYSSNSVFEKTYFIKGGKKLKSGDAFPLPDSIGYEIVDKYHSKFPDKVIGQIARLKLKSIPKKDETKIPIEYSQQQLSEF